MLNKFELPLPPTHNNKQYNAKFKCRILHNTKYPNSLSFLGPNMSKKIFDNFKKTGIKENLPLYTKEDNLNQTIFPIFLDFDSTPYKNFKLLHNKLESILDNNIFNISYSPSGRVKVWFMVQTPNLNIRLKDILSIYDDEYIKNKVINYLKTNILKSENHHLLNYLDSCSNGMFRCYISPDIKNKWISKNNLNPIDLKEIIPSIPSAVKQAFHWKSDFLVVNNPPAERGKEYTLCTYVSTDRSTLKNRYTGSIPKALQLRKNNTTGRAILRVLLATPQLLNSFFLNQQGLSDSINSLYNLSTTQQSVSKHIKVFIDKGWLKIVKTYIKGVRSTYYQATGELKHWLQQLYPVNKTIYTQTKEVVKEDKKLKVVILQGTFWTENVKAYKKYYKNYKDYYEWSKIVLNLSKNLVSKTRLKTREQVIKSTLNRIKKDSL